ncbi:hypothetical protein D3C76_1778840 [compost metagenome]
MLHNDRIDSTMVIGNDLLDGGLQMLDTHPGVINQLLVVQKGVSVVHVGSRARW